MCYSNRSWECNTVPHSSVLKTCFVAINMLFSKLLKNFLLVSDFKEMFTTGWNSSPKLLCCGAGHHMPAPPVCWTSGGGELGHVNPDNISLIVTIPQFDFYSTSHICLPNPAICLSISLKHYFPLWHKQFISGELLYTKRGLWVIFHPLTYVNPVH